MRTCRSLLGSESAIARQKRSMNQSSEYWYIGSMAASEAMQKKSTAERYETGLYDARASSILISVSSAIFCLAPISSESFLAPSRISMAEASSRIEPPADSSTSRIWSSTSESCFLLEAPSCTSRLFSSSRSGRSLATTMPSSWSSRPSGVIMKLSSVTLTWSSGR